MKLLGHLKTVFKHKRIVFVHCRKAGIWWQGLWHDMSKLSLVELVPSVKYYTGEKSPTEYERRENGYSMAWVHHKGRNRHHFEHWTDYHPETRKIAPVKMPIRFVKEMFCDRVAASKVYLGKEYTDSHPIGYLRRGTAKNNMHPETARLLEDWLTILEEKGEAEAFKVIRNTKSY